MPPESTTIRCIPAIVEDRARESPGAVALVDRFCTVTYGQLKESSSTLAQHLRTLGVGRDSVVGLCLDRSTAFVIAALGVMKAGAAYLPLEHAHPAQRLQFELEDCGAEVLVSTESMSQNRRLVAPHVLFLERIDSRSREGTTEDGEMEVFPQDLAYLMYTSGSTGRPKGVEISHGSLVNLVSWHQREFQVTESDRASQLASVAFDASVWEVWPYLASGASVHIAGDWVARDPLRLRDWLAANSITCGFAPTRLAERLMRLEWPADVRLRVLLTGGERLNGYPPLGLPFSVVNNYGPTECTVVATSATIPPLQKPSGPPPIGRPIANTSVYILNEDLEPVENGEAGEIWIAGAGVARGYRGRPDLTAERFRSNPFDVAVGSRIYRTGDRGRILDDGQVAFLGRTDSQVKVRGYRTELEEIERLLSQHPSVEECAVVTRDTVRGDLRLAAYVVARAGCEITAADMRDFLAVRVPEPMVPTSFVRMEQLPVTESGKTDRTALRNIDSYPSAIPGRGHPVAALSVDELSVSSERFSQEPERRLQEVWREILQVHSVPTNADFFMDLGGDSLQAVQLFAEIEKVWGMKLPITVLLERRTVAGVAQAIRQGKEQGPGSPLVAFQTTGALDPIFCIHSHNGDALFFRRLSEYVGPERPVYAFQSQALAGRALHFSVEEAASCYVDELLKVQPQGPCSLFGFCYGGLVAFEMAQRLTALGRSVSFLCMFNVPPPGALTGWPLGQLGYLGKRIGEELRRMHQFSPTEKGAHLLRNAWNFGWMLARSIRIDAWRLSAGILRQGTARRLAPHFLDVGETNIAAGKNYQPRGVFQGRITYIVSPELPYLYLGSPEAGWSPFVAGGIEMVTVPSANELHPHEAMLRVVAEKLRQTVNDGGAYDSRGLDPLECSQAAGETW